MRHIVEFCTSENSQIGDKRYTKDGCSVTRCSLKDSVTTNKGLKRALDGVRKPKCLLWASMPCIGGSPWQHINRHKSGGLMKLDAHIKDWYKIWTCFQAVARECIKHSVSNTTVVLQLNGPQDVIIGDFLYSAGVL